MPIVEVVAGLEVELGALADLAEHDRVLLGHPFRRIGVGQVRQCDGDPAELRLDLLQLLLAGLDPLLQPLHGRHQLRRVPPGLLLLADLLRERLALGLGGLDLGQELAAADVEPEQLVDLRGGATPGQGRLDPLGVGANQLQVEHGAPALGRGLFARARRGFGFGAGVLGDEFGDLVGLVADDDVLRHDRSGEAAVLDREKSILIGLRSLIQVRTLHPLAAVAAALGAGGAEGVATGAVRGEEDSALVVGVVLRDRDPFLPEAAGREAERGGEDHAYEQYGAHAARIILSGADPSLTMPPPDPASFRAAMAALPTGVTVVAAGGADGPAGATANAVCSLSIEPMLMLACLDRGSRTLLAVQAADRFGISVLHAGQEEIARAFATKAPVAEKWAGVAWSARDGIPAIDDALLWIACDLRDVIAAGDHVIVTGEVRDLEIGKGDPLVFHGGGYQPLRTQDGTR